MRRRHARGGHADRLPIEQPEFSRPLAPVDHVDAEGEDLAVHGGTGFQARASQPNPGREFSDLFRPKALYGTRVSSR